MFEDFKTPQWIVDNGIEHTEPNDAMPSFIFGKYIVAVDAEDASLSEFCSERENSTYKRFCIYDNLGMDAEFTDFGDLLAEVATLEEVQDFLAANK